jgi:beta-galactosidase
MWTGIDYLGEARWPSKNSSSGVIDLCGFPKDAYYFYKSQWTNEPMIHLFPHWNWQGKEGKVIPVMVYTNCDSVELFVNGRSFGIKSLQFPRPGNSGAWNRYDVPPVYTSTGDLHLSWDVPYEPGVLKAIGRREGKVVFTKEIKTTGKPAAIRLSSDQEKWEKMKEVQLITIEVVDENGNTVPDASSEIKLTIEGNGKLLGFDNGDPNDHTNMKSVTRKVFNGKALAIVQLTGSATIRAESNGLSNAVVAMKSPK